MADAALSGRVILVGLALAAALAAPGALAEPRRAGNTLDVDLARYRTGARPPVTVRGRVFEERRPAQSADRPLSGAVVTLLPRSDAFLGRLAALKATARDSIDMYARAAAGMKRAQSDYEQALRETGAADLINVTAAGADGTFSVSVVPGDWILIGWRSAGDLKSTAPRSQSGRFSSAQRRGHEGVTVWLREVPVSAGASDMIELKDRNVWFSGVAEKVPGAGR